MRKWFNNLKVAQKLMLISFFFVMPDSIMLYLFITGINQNIQFARWESIGKAMFGLDSDWFPFSL